VARRSAPKAGRRPGRTLADRADADPAVILPTLAEHQVESVVIGGVAALAHGVQRITRDIDFLVGPGARNCRRAIAALVELGAAEWRPASKRWVRLSPKADPAWLLREPRFFDTRAGGIDLCNAMRGAPEWKTARPRAIEVEAFGCSFLVLDLDTLIRSKLAAGREKDRADVAELNELGERP
jgi:hypothetical protein